MWRRLLALVYDVLIVVAIMMVVGLLCQLATGGQADRHRGQAQRAGVVPGAAGAGGGRVFHQRLARGGQTVGMRPWRIRVTRADGGAPTMQQAMMRLLVAAAPLVLLCCNRCSGCAPRCGRCCSSCGRPGSWLALLDPRRRAVHDLVAHTEIRLLRLIFTSRIPPPGPDSPMTDARPAESRSDAELIRANRGFYESLWSEARLIGPERFNTWPLVRELAAAAPRRLEVAPGLRPRLPLEGTCFVDLSHAALRRLHERGATAVHGMIGALPCADASFDLVCALDILEHVADDDGALAELARVAAPGASVLLSVPLHPEAWTAFDDFVGHCRRYEPARIVANAWPTTASASNRARSTACSRSPRACSTSASGISPTSGNARCGGTTGCSCRWGCASRNR